MCVYFDGFYVLANLLRHNYYINYYNSYGNDITVLVVSTVL